MENGEKSLATPESAEGVIREFCGSLDGLRYAQYFGHLKEVAEDVERLKRLQIGSVSALTRIKWAVAQPGFETLYKQYRIDPYDRHDTWKEFQEFIASL